MKTFNMLIIHGSVQPKISWTRHSKMKMSHYRLSEARVKRVMRYPQRVEEGIVPNTIACMQTAGKTEIWMMYQKHKAKEKNTVKIITAWRYPGKSPKGKELPIPKDILNELINIL